jgi:hypothetical protein
MLDIISAKKIDNIRSIQDDVSDDLFITCASFEDRCLGSFYKIYEYHIERIIIFKFTEPNPTREKNYLQMNEILKTNKLEEKLHTISVEHGMTMKSILELHNYCKANLLNSHAELKVTLDITTFTKGLLLETLFYFTNILKVKKLRFLYTVPEKYASPEEGSLSHGIKKIKILPFFWNSWSSTKDDCLMVILGYEEMRAWSLISRFDANVNTLLITNPGSKPEWDLHCEKYNERLLKENYDKKELPAMEPLKVIQVFEEILLDEKIHERYNLFIAPFGTKPQILGIFYFMLKHPEFNINIITTTAVEHNAPYYSWGIGDTYCMLAEELVSISGASDTP